MKNWTNHQLLVAFAVFFIVTGFIGAVALASLVSGFKLYFVILFILMLIAGIVMASRSTHTSIYWDEQQPLKNLIK